MRVLLLILLAVWNVVADAHQDPLAAKTLLIFVDDLHIAFRQTPHLRTGLKAATRRVDTSGWLFAVVSDGTSNVSIEATNDTAPLESLSNRISGSGLKPDDLTNPTPAVEREITRRESTAVTALQTAVARIHPNAVVFISDRETELPDLKTSIFLTRPENTNAALVRALGIASGP